VKNYIKFIMKGGNSFSVHIKEESLRVAISDVKKRMDENMPGTTYTLYLGDDISTVILVSEIAAFFHYTVSEDESATNEKEKTQRRRLLDAQVSYYESLARGESWKNDEGWRGD